MADDLMREQLRERLNQKQCPTCPNSVNMFEGPATGPHYARIICGDCGAWLDWLPWPKDYAEQKKNRPAVRVTRLDEDRCVICLRTRLQVEALGQQLHAHHLDDRASLVEGGYAPDIKERMAWLCSQDHEFVSMTRRYADRMDALFNVQVILDSVEIDNNG